MSNTHATTTDHTHATTNNHRPDAQPTRRVSSETKPSLKTTELAVYVLAVLGVLIASAIVDSSDFGAQEAWKYVTWLTIGYLLSRGLAKSGARNFNDDDNR